MTNESKTASIVLDVKDRFMIQELFPARATLVEQIIAQDIAKKVVLSQEDSAAIGLENIGGMVKWREDAKLELTIELTGAEVEFLDKQVNAKSSASEISLDMVNVCRKIQQIARAL